MLGVHPEAAPEEVAARYRALAKRWHPDRAGSREAERRMALINTAYAQVRDARGTRATRVADPGRVAPPARPVRPGGWWLEASVRDALGVELVAALDLGESVALVVGAATWAGRAVVAVTARRLLWLHDDAVIGRVRALRWIDVAGAEVRATWPRRRRTVVRVQRVRGARGPVFGELEPADAQALARTVQDRAQRGVLV